MKAVFCLWSILATVGSSFAQETATEFKYPLAVAAASDGTIYVADRTLPGIWTVKGHKKSTYFLASRRFRTPLNAVRCLAVDDQGKLLAGDSATREVFRFDDAGKPQPLTKGSIGIPMSLAVAPDGTIYTADLELHRIWKMPATGSEKPEEFAVVNSPRGLTLDSEGNLWVLSTSSKDGQIQKITPDGKIEPFVKDHPFSLPHNIVLMSDGSFFVTDNYERAVWKVTPDGTPEKFISGPPLDRPVGLCRLDANLLVADPRIRTIFSLAPDKTLTVLASSPVDPAKPTAPFAKPAHNP